MSLLIKKSGALLGDDLRLKILVYGLSGKGKTKFIGTVPGIGVAACETGHGNGILSIAQENIDYVEPENFKELEAFCKQSVFKDNPAVGLDSLTAMVRTYIKDETLKIPRAQGNSAKRDKGVPELDDYGVMGEITRNLLNQLFATYKDKHVIVTALEKYDKAGPNDAPGTESLIVPDLPGQMALAAPAMFDLVFRLKEKAELLDPRDAKSRIVRRYLITQADGTGCIAKCRLNRPGLKLSGMLDKEELFDPDSGKGTFPVLLEKIKEAMKAV